MDGQTSSYCQRQSLQRATVLLLCFSAGVCIFVLQVVLARSLKSCFDNVLLVPGVVSWIAEALLLAAILAAAVLEFLAAREGKLCESSVCLVSAAVVLGVGFGVSLWFTLALSVLDPHFVTCILMGWYINVYTLGLGAVFLAVLALACGAGIGFVVWHICFLQVPCTFLAKAFARFLHYGRSVSPEPSDPTAVTAPERGRQ